MSKTYSEHNKVHAIKDKLDAINSFLDWLMMEREQPVRLMLSYSAETHEDGDPLYRNGDGEVIEDWVPPRVFHDSKKVQAEKERRERDEGIDRRMIYDQRGSTFMDLRLRRESLMAEYFEVDEAKLEAEKREMLEEIRGTA